MFLFFYYTRLEKIEGFLSVVKQSNMGAIYSAYLSEENQVPVNITFGILGGILVLWGIIVGIVVIVKNRIDRVTSVDSISPLSYRSSSQGLGL